MYFMTVREGGIGTFHFIKDSFLFRKKFRDNGLPL